MLKLLYDVSSAIINKAIAAGQLIFATDTNQLLIDIGNSRYPVKDPTAGKALSYSNQILSLKDDTNTVIDSVELDPTLDFQMTFDSATGHLYWGSINESD